MEREQSEIATAYNDWAETYDTVENRTRDLAAETLRQLNLNLDGRRIVEVGCGTGRNTTWLAERSADIVGLDFSEAMLARARTRVSDPGIRFVQHDVSVGWPLAAASAEVVIAMLILEHVEHLQPVFKEAARVLSRGGQFFVCELHPVLQLLGKQARFTNARTGENTLVTAFIHRTDDYLQAADAAGFELLSAVDVHDRNGEGDLPRLLSLHFQRPTLSRTGAVS